MVYQETQHLLLLDPQGGQATPPPTTLPGQVASTSIQGLFLTLANSSALQLQQPYKAMYW